MIGYLVILLPTLLLPLAGPEEFSESENDKLPMNLQYLENDKERETDADIRKMLVECLMMVRCLTRSTFQSFPRLKQSWPKI